MCKRIEIYKTPDRIHFYLVNGSKCHYMFTQKFTIGVYEYFYNGRTIAELKKFHRWGKNPRLDKTVEKIPMYIKYLERMAA